MAETHNMQQISVERFINEIRNDLEDGNYDPIIGLGKAGVGKTVSIAELCKEMGIGYKEMRLVCLGEIDILGLPTIENGRTTYAANALLPDENGADGEIGILVLDEITSAEPGVRAAAYQLLDSKRSLGNYHLPPKWKCVALGNGLDDGGVFKNIESAFISRCQCYRIEPDLDSWTRWATKSGVNPTVIAYLKFAPDQLHKMNVDEIASVFPCPRSWTMLAKKITAREKKAPNGVLNREDVELYASGFIGSRDSAAFAAFYAYKEQTIPAADILAGKGDTNLSKYEPQMVYISIENAVNAAINIFKQEEQPRGFTDKTLETAVNLIKWIVAISKTRVDYGFSALSDIGAGYSKIVEVFLSDKFRKACPELEQFRIENAKVFS